MKMHKIDLNFTEHGCLLTLLLHVFLGLQTLFGSDRVHNCVINAVVKNQSNRRIICRDMTKVSRRARFFWVTLYESNYWDNFASDCISKSWSRLFCAIFGAVFCEMCQSGMSTHFEGVQECARLNGFSYATTVSSTPSR